jgi:PKD repeat protein
MSDGRFWTVALLLAAGCSSPRKVAPPNPAPPAAVGFTLAADDRYEARQPKHAAAMGPDGTMRVTPRAAGAALALKLESVQRGAAESEGWSMPAPESRRLDDGALVVQWPHGVVERWESSARALEQTFVLTAPPEGVGELVLHLSAAGLAYDGRDADAHRFRDVPSGAALRYGEAFARVGGELRPLEVRQSGGGLDLVVPESLVRERGAWPLIIDPTLMPVDQPVTSLALHDDVTPKIAAINGGWVSAWVDWRNVSNSDIYLARFSPDLTMPADPYGIRVTTGRNNQTEVSIACDAAAGKCLLAWTAEYASAPVQTKVMYSLFHADAGSLSNPQSLDPAQDVFSPAVATDSKQFFIAYLVGGTGTVVRGNWIDRVTGNPLTAVDIATSGGVDMGRPSVASAGPGDFLVVWKYGTSVSAMHVEGSSAMDPSPVGFFPYAPSDPPVVANNGNGTYAVVWSSVSPITANNGSDIVGMRLVVDGGTFTPLDMPPIVIAGSMVDETNPAVAGTLAGGGVDVSWLQTGIIYTSRWATQFPVPTPRVSVNPNQANAASACDGYMTCAIVFDEPNASGVERDVYGGLDPAPQPYVEHRISIAANTEVHPSVAANHGEFMTVWRDSRVTNDFDIFGERLSENGVLVGTAFPITFAGGATDEPVIVSDGSGFIVAWTQLVSANTVVVATLLDADGGMHSQTMALNGNQNGQGAPALAHNILGYVIVYEQGRPMSQIYGAVIDSTGSIVKSAAPVNMGSLLQRRPAAASNGPVTLVAWTENPGTTQMDTLRAIHLAPDLSPLDPSPITISAIANTTTHVAVTSDGTDFLVAWTDISNHVMASRVFGDGGLQDPNGAVLAYGEPRLSAAYDGLSYVVSWQTITPDGGDPSVIVQRVFGSGPNGSIAIPDAGSADLAYIPGKGGLAVVEHFDKQVEVPRVWAETLPRADAGLISNPPMDAGSPDAGPFGIICDAGTQAMVGVPYVFNEQGRVLTSGVGTQVTFGDCSNGSDEMAGLFVDGRSGAVWWTPTATGHYSFCVDVTPGGGGPAFACTFGVDVTEPVGSAPSASLSFDKPNVQVGETVTADGSGSMPQGGLVYRWDFGDMSPLEFGPAPQHSYLLPGSYQVQLTVLDAWGRSDSAKKAVQVLDLRMNTAPVANVHQMQTSPGTFQLTCNGCGNAAYIVWDFGDGGVLTAPDVATVRSYPPGRYRVRLRAVDSNGMVGNDSDLLEVDDPGLGAPPVCHGNVSPTAGLVPQRFTFDVDGLSNPGGAISQITYTFADGGARLEDHNVQLRSTSGIERGGLIVSSANGLNCFDDVYGVGLAKPSNAAPPRFESTPVTPAACGAKYTLTPVVEGTQPITLSLANALPGDTSIDRNTGSLIWTPPVGTRRSYSLTLVATNEAGSDQMQLDVLVTCPNSFDFSTCSCGTGAAGPMMLGLLLLCWRRRRA